jgi:predicted alpha/beta hydrolase
MKAGPRVHRVTSVDAVITVEEYGPEHRHRRASLVFLPALGVPLSYYRPLLEHWTGRGRHLVAVELRGMPQSPVRDLRQEAFGYSRLVRHDVPAVLAHEVLSSTGKVVIVGHSLGGQLALLSTASGTAHPEAVVTIAAGSSFAVPRLTLRQRLVRRLGVRFVATATTVIGYWPGHLIGFAGRQPKALIKDWAYEGRHGRYRLGGDPTDYEAALASLRTPTLLVGLIGDPMIPLPAVDHLADRLPAHVDRATIDTGLALDHFLWARRRPGPVVNQIEAWLDHAGL